MNEVASPRNYAKSASRALELMSYFAEERRPAKASEIAHALNIPASSADQLLKTLVLDGYLLRDSGLRTYFPSPRMSKFCDFFTQFYPEQNRLMHLIQSVHECTGETVTLTMANDCYMQVMNMAYTAETECQVESGFRVPIVGSAIGGAALTTRTPREIVQFITRAKRQRALFERNVSTTSVLEDIQLYRMKGYSWCRSEGNRYRVGVGADIMWYSLAMPVANTGFPSVVLGLTGPAKRVQAKEREIISLMRREIRNHSVDAAAGCA